MRGYVKVGADSDGEYGYLWGNPGNLWNLYKPNVGTDLRLLSYGAGGDVMSFKADTGYVGIGTTAPGQLLHLSKAGTAGVQTPLLVLESATSLRPLLQFSENGAAVNSGMSIEYDGRGSGATNLLYINNVSGGPVVTFTSGGNVGIGTTSPVARLELYDGGMSANSLLTIQADDSGPWAYRMLNRLYSTDLTNSFKGYQDQNGVFHMYNMGVDTLDFKSGNVGIGAADPGSYKLYVAGTLYTSGGCTGCSDLRWKANVSTIPDALGTVERLRGVQFNWRTSEYPKMFFGNGTDVGLVAQEAEKVAPELVYEVDGYKYIRYDRLSALLIEATKEQQKEIESQKSEMDQLKKENDALKADNEALKKAVCEINPKAEICVGV